MPNNLNVLPNPALKPEVTNCALLEGDLEVWIVCCSQRFFPLARRIARDNSLAEDALQASWIKILQSINHAYFNGPKACPWVSRIVANTAKDTIRRRSRHREVPFNSRMRPNTRSPEDLAQERQLLALLREMVSLLPDTYRQVVELRVYAPLDSTDRRPPPHLKWQRPHPPPPRSPPPATTNRLPAVTFLRPGRCNE